MPEIDESVLLRFMASIRKRESGSSKGNYAARNKSSGAYGAYQIMPQYWDGWAAQAGIPGADIRDQAAQDYVASYKFRQYFRALNGDWGMVAVAWFAGLGAAQQAVREGAKSEVWNRSDGNMKVSEYYAEINERMGQQQADFYESLVPAEPVQTPEAAAQDEFRNNMIGMLTTMSDAIANGSRLPVGARINQGDISNPLADAIKIGDDKKLKRAGSEGANIGAQAAAEQEGVDANLFSGEMPV